MHGGRVSRRASWIGSWLSGVRKASAMCEHRYKVFAVHRWDNLTDPGVFRLELFACMTNLLKDVIATGPDLPGRRSGLIVGHVPNAFGTRSACSAANDSRWFFSKLMICRRN